VRCPAAEGVNVNSIVQLAPTATELPQVSAVSAKSPGLEPESVTLVMLNVPLPLLVRASV